MSVFLMEVINHIRIYLHVIFLRQQYFPLIGTQIVTDISYTMVQIKVKNIWTLQLWADVWNGLILQQIGA